VIRAKDDTSEAASGIRQGLSREGSMTYRQTFFTILFVFAVVGAVYAAALEAGEGHVKPYQRRSIP